MTITIVEIPLVFKQARETAFMLQANGELDAWRQKNRKYQDEMLNILDQHLEDGFEIISEQRVETDSHVMTMFFLRKWRLQEDVDRALRLRLDGPVGCDSIDEIPDCITQSDSSIP